MSTFYSYFLSNFKRLCFGGEERKFVGLTKISHLFHSQPKTSFSLYVLVWIALISAASAFPQVFFFFLFFSFQPQWLTRSSVNSAFMHCSQISPTPFFINFFIKNGSHSTIHTFKNYFATVFSVFNFQFSKISSI